MNLSQNMPSDAHYLDSGPGDRYRNDRGPYDDRYRYESGRGGYDGRGMGRRGDGRYRDYGRDRDRRGRYDRYERDRGYGDYSRRDDFRSGGVGSRGNTRAYRDKGPVVPVGRSGERRYFRQGPSGWDVKEPNKDAFQLVDGAATNALMTPLQQTRHARKIYAGGLSNVTEEEIANYFNDLVKRSILRPLPQDISPVISVFYNPERKFAFVEFISIEIATAFAQLDGIMFRDQPLRIRRPKDYDPSILPPELREKPEPLNFNVLPLSQPPPVPGNDLSLLIGSSTGHPSASYDSATGTSNVVDRSSPHRIFIGNLPAAVDDRSLGDILGAFGPLRSLQLVKNPDGTHKGYAFAEYENPELTDTVIASLNGFAIGDRNITLSYAKSTNDSSGSVPQYGERTDNAYRDQPNQQQQYSNQGYSAYPPQAHSQATGAAPSRVVLLMNMLNVDELKDDNEHASILEDIKSETSRHGPVKVEIPRPPHPAVGRVFLYYDTTDSAARAIDDLTGRKFDERVIHASYYDEASFLNGNWELNY